MNGSEITPVLATNIQGVFVLKNIGTDLAMQYSNGNTYQQPIDYSDQGLLFRISPYAGNEYLGLPGGTHLLEPVVLTEKYMSKGSYWTNYVNFPTHPLLSTLWYFYYIEAFDAYKIVPAGSTGTALSAPSTTAGDKVEIMNGSTTDSWMMWELTPNFSWYSQKIPQLGWKTGVFDDARTDAFPISELIFSGGEYAGNSLAYAIDMEGCHLNSIAMLLANMDYYTNDLKYDVRYGSYRKVFADPYTAAMTNLNIGDWSMASDGVLEGSWSNPMYAVYSRFTDVFSVTVTKIELANYNLRQKAQYVTNMLELHPEGLIIKYSGHSAVVISSTYTANTSLDDIDDSFIVCDPGKIYSHMGNAVTLTQSSRSLSEVESIYYIDPQS